MRTSKLGLWVAGAGFVIGFILLAAVVVIALMPDASVLQEWGIGLAFVAAVAASLIFMGLRWWLSFRAAERIATRSVAAERRGVHPLVTLGVAAVFGGAMIIRPVRREISEFLSHPGALENEGYGLVLLVLGAPVIIFVLGVMVMAKHRANRPSNVQEHIAQKQGEKRHSMMLMIATPVIILIPYFIWVSMQPGPDTFVATNPWPIPDTSSN